MHILWALLTLSFFSISTGAHANCVALTFDDGPNGKFTQPIVDALGKAGMLATFFVVGRWVETYPEIFKAMAAAGHESGSHMYLHDRLDLMPASRVSEMIAKNDAVIKKYTGREPQVLRAPYFGENAQVRANEAARGRPFVQADVDPKDYFGRSAAAITKHVLRHTQPGSIILLHDIHPQTVLAVPAILAGLKQKGFKLVTVSQLLGSRCGTIHAKVRQAILD